MEKNKIDKKFFQALAVMIGYVIGVGMFSLPFLVSRSGVIAFAVLVIVLGFSQYLIHLIYANVICATVEYHRMAGYVGIYLGKKGKIAVFIAKVVGNYGALLAYIIITGIFLNQLLGEFLGGSEFIYSTVAFVVMAGILYFGIGMIARAELIMSSLLILSIFLIAWKGFGNISFSNYQLIDYKYLFLAYGALLFALDGNGSLPIVVKLLRRDKKKVKKVVALGTLIPAIVMIAFTFIIVGISGDATTEDALSGVRAVFDNGVIFFILIFGVLSMLTSFIGVSEALKETFVWDFKVGEKKAWALAVFIPYLLYIAGFQNFIQVIGFAGAVAGGFTASMLLLVFLVLKKKEKSAKTPGKYLVLFERQPHNFLIYALMLLFVAGIVYEVVVFF